MALTVPPLPLQFWKQLVGEAVTFADVEDMDAATKKLLHDLEHIEADGIDESQWPDLAERLNLRYGGTGLQTVPTIPHSMSHRASALRCQVHGR